MDIDVIQKEIESRKKQRGQENAQAGVIPSDRFLHQLKESLETGRPTQASTKLNLVKNASEGMEVAGNAVVKKNPLNEQAVNEAMRNVPATPVAQPNVPTTPQYNQPTGDPNAMDPREEQFYQNLQETKQLLGQNNNMGMADAMSQYMKPQGQNGMINSPNALNEAVQREVNNFMSNIDFPKLVEDIVKSTMMEMYQKEKVEAALNENSDLVQKMVVNTIINLKKQNAKQTTKK